MTRTVLLSLLLAAFCGSASSPVQAESRFEKSARVKRELASKIAWPSHEPLTFMLRRGRHAESLFETYDRQHAPDNVRAMADAGVRYGRLRFYKGLGLEMEAPEIQKTQNMADLMHKLGMKVSLYVAGTMFPEVFYREVPEAALWEQRDQWSRPVFYIETQTFRRFACMNEPAYKEYIKKVLRIGVQQIKADQIFFDNVFLLPEPKSCRCPRCEKAFTAFLKQRYPTPEAAFRRFGYPSAEYIRVNEWDVFNAPEGLESLDDPILQEWTRFRCDTVAKHCAEFYDYVKGLNPNISVGFNLKGTYGLNRMWRNAIYHPLHAGKIDFSPFDVGGMEARVDSRTGALVSEIRSYKMARTLGFSYEEGGGPLDIALLMAFNPQKHVPGYGYQGDPHHTRGVERSFSPEAEFFREYSERYFADTESVADVAVVRSWPSMAYSISATLVPTILMEQVLIQYKVPFDIIFDEQMDRIDRYRAVILAGQESLSKQWVEKLTAYAKNGGTVVFTGDTADYNDWRERRDVNPLRALLGATKAGMLSTKGLGEGKLVYIPEITPGITGRAETRRIGIAGDETASAATTPIRGGSFAGADWVLPKNHLAIHQAVAGNLHGSASITTGAPPTTVLELLNRPKTNETVIHFVNVKETMPQPPFRVRVRKQYPDRKTTGVNFLTPESDEPGTLQFIEEKGWITFTTRPMSVYSMAVIRYE